MVLKKKKKNPYSTFIVPSVTIHQTVLNIVIELKVPVGDWIVKAGNLEKVLQM